MYMQKSTVWSKQNVGVLQRAQKDLESKAEDENEYEKSRFVYISNVTGTLT